MQEASEPPRRFEPQAVIDAMAPLLGLPIEPAFRPGIAMNLEVTARFAARLFDFPLCDQAEPAAVFRP